MFAVLLWLRRSTAFALLPFGLAAALVMLFSRGGWQYEWGWALSQAASATILLCPLVAGVVAFERARRFAPTLELISNTLTRPARWALPLGAALPAIAAMLITCAIAAALVLRHGPGPATDLWVLGQVPAALLGAAGWGLLVGRAVSGPVAGPLAAITCYAMSLLGRYFGIPTLFSAGGATGTLIGAEQIPTIAAGAIACHAAVLGVALMRERYVPQGRRGAWWSMPNIVTALAVAGVMTFGVTLGGADTLRTATEPVRCYGIKPTVCGPASGDAVLRVAQRSLAEALVKLEPTGVPWRERYVLATGDQLLTIREDSGLLRVAPDGIDDGRASTADLAATLAMPRLCQEQFESDPGGITEQQGAIQRWLVGELTKPAPTAAPRDLLASYQVISNCTPARRG